MHGRTHARTHWQRAHTIHRYLLDPVRHRGTTDIFFASDFAFLQVAYHDIIMSAPPPPPRLEDGGDGDGGTGGTGSSGGSHSGGGGGDGGNKAVPANNNSNKNSNTIMRRRTLAVRSVEFTTEHADLARTQLANTTYNPLTEDFTNIQFLLGESIRE